MSTQHIYIPYFYIIQDTRNSKYYAGSKYGQDANPSTFMIENGYQTSSNIILKIIEEFGLEVFIVRKLKIFATGDEAYNYETKFLQKVNAADHSKFYNGHNNDGIAAFGTKKFKSLMLKKYGVEFYSIHEDYTEKTKATSKLKYGKEYYMQTEEYKNRYYITSMEKYGTPHHLMNEKIIQKRKFTNLEKYGIEHPIQNVEVMKERIDRLSVKYGDNIINVNQLQTVKDKKLETNMKKRGVENPSQDSIIKENKRQNQLIKSNRECVKTLRRVCKENKIHMGNGWYLKSDEFIINKTMEIIDGIL